MKLRKLIFRDNNFLVWLFSLLVIIIFSLLIYRLYNIQIAKAVLINNFSETVKKIPPLRGDIYLVDKDNNQILIATSYYLYDLYYYPPKAKNIDEEIKHINSIVALKNIDELTNLVKNSQKSVILAKNLTIDIKNKIENLNYDSVFFEEKVYRDYPLKDVFSIPLGFVNFDYSTGFLEGQYGLEKYYNEILKGQVGYRKKNFILQNSRKGADLVLNIDFYIQKKIEEILKNKIEEYKAAGGLIIVAEVKTGNILGVAELPGYDLNKYNQVKDYSFFISRLSKNYEPGSVMKPFFYAAAFQENLVKPEDTYEDKGYVILNNWRIENFDKKGRGVIDLKTALEQSLNTGSVYIAQVLGKSRFLKYVENFKLNKKAEVDFPILEEPNFNNLYNPGREVNFGTASFGQGVALSPLNLVQSFNAFANDGQIIKLNFVKKISYDNKNEKQIKVQLIAKPLTKETIDKILPILEGVVENQAKKAGKLGYRIAGKTGSALIPVAKENLKISSLGSGYTDEAITTFIGFFPVSNPQYIILVRLDKPAKGLLSFGTAAPTFRKVVDFLVNYYNIEPDKPEEILKQNFNF